MRWGGGGSSGEKRSGERKSPKIGGNCRRNRRVILINGRERRDERGGLVQTEEGAIQEVGEGLKRSSVVFMRNCTNFVTGHDANLKVVGGARKKETHKPRIGKWGYHSSN